MTKEEIEAMQAENAKLKEGMSGMDKMQTSIDALESKNREILSEKATAKKAAEDAAAAAARKSGDVEALETSWKEKLANETTARDTQIDEYKSMINKMTVGTAANSLANELAVAGSADLLLPHIERRLTVEMSDGKPIVRVLGQDGKPSASTLDDLKAELGNNAAYAPILVGSKASGSGEVGNKGSQGKGKTITRDSFDSLGNVERAAFFKAGGKIE